MQKMCWLLGGGGGGDLVEARDHRILPKEEAVPLALLVLRGLQLGCLAPLPAVQNSVRFCSELQAAAQGQEESHRSAYATMDVLLLPQKCVEGIRSPPRGRHSCGKRIPPAHRFRWETDCSQSEIGASPEGAGAGR